MLHARDALTDSASHNDTVVPRRTSAPTVSFERTRIYVSPQTVYSGVVRSIDGKLVLALICVSHLLFEIYILLAQ